VVNRRIEPGLLHSQSCRRVALRVEIHEEGRALGKREACSQVDGGRGLSNAALLVDDREDPSYWVVPRATLTII